MTLPEVKALVANQPLAYRLGYIDAHFSNAHNPRLSRHVIFEHGDPRRHHYNAGFEAAKAAKGE